MQTAGTHLKRRLSRLPPKFNGIIPSFPVEKAVYSESPTLYLINTRAAAQLVSKLFQSLRVPIACKSISSIHIHNTPIQFILSKNKKILLPHFNDTFRTLTFAYITTEDTFQFNIELERATINTHKAINRPEIKRTKSRAVQKSCASRTETNNNG